MICSVELPIKYLDNSKHFDFDFIIASTCLEHPKYMKYYLKKEKSRLTILDNGAFETGKAIDDETYLELARKLQPDILVIPDVYKDNAATGHRAVNFLKKWEHDPIEGVKLMGVLQGTTWDNLVSLYKTIYASVCDYIGLPYATGIDRYQFLKAHPEIKNIHILGTPTLSEIYSLNLLPNVVSIDSSLAVKCTKEGLSIDEKIASDELVKPDEKELDPTLLEYNLKLFSAVCNKETHITWDGGCMV